MQLLESQRRQDPQQAYLRRSEAIQRFGMDDSWVGRANQHMGQAMGWAKPQAANAASEQLGSALAQSGASGAAKGVAQSAASGAAKEAATGAAVQSGMAAAGAAL